MAGVRLVGTGMMNELDWDGLDLVGRWVSLGVGSVLELQG